LRKSANNSWIEFDQAAKTLSWYNFHETLFASLSLYIRGNFFSTGPALTGKPISAAEAFVYDTQKVYFQ
jgi:hypothetical protein